MTWLIPPRLVLLLLLGMALYHFVAPVAQIIGWPWRWAGLFVAGIGIWMILSGVERFSRAGTEINTFGVPRTLVTDGLFGFSRNPIYLGMLILLIGAAVLFGSVVAFAGPLIFFLVADAWYIPFEERNAETAFGENYAIYQSHVRRWF